MTSRRMRVGKNAAVASLLFLAILTLVNFLVARYFFRIDLTENKEFTISEATKTILGRMDDIVNLKVYFSRDLPSYLATLNNEVDDMLEEFRAYSKGNLVIDFEDPSQSPESESRVRRLGIPQVQLDVIRNDSRSIQNAYLGMAVLYEDRSETIPVIYSTENLEYELAQSVVKVLQKEKKTIGFLTGHDEMDLYDQYDVARQELERQYLVQKVDLQGGKQKVPEKIAALVIPGTAGVNEREKYLIDQYLMGGGKLIVLEDAIQLIGGALQARPIRSGLENLLPLYGIKVDENLVLDRRCAVAGFRSGFFQYMVPYPYWPKVTKEGLSQESPIVSRLESVVMPWVSSVSQSEMKPESVQFIRLAWTSDSAWEMTGAYNLNPTPIALPEPDKMKGFTVAAALTGKFKSYFADQPTPPAPVDSLAAMAAQLPADEPKITESPETQIVVVGTSHLVNNNFLGQFPANMTFFLNTIDWVALGNELIAIRSRSVSDRPLDADILKAEAEGKRNTIKFAGTFGMPILLTLFGMVRWLARRSEKRAFVASIQEGEPGV